MMRKQPEAAAGKTGTADVWRLLGLAARAGRTAAGSETAVKMLRGRKAYLVMLAEDAAENTARQFIFAAGQSNVPLCRFGQKSELGRWTGSAEKAVVVITDESFANRLRELIAAVESDDAGLKPAEMENNMSS